LQSQIVEELDVDVSGALKPSLAYVPPPLMTILDWDASAASSEVGIGDHIPRSITDVV
jgi:hypothetical protein